MGRDVAADVAGRLGILDLDDLGAEVGEVHTAERPGAVLLDGDDPHVGQRVFHRGRRGILPGPLVELVEHVGHAPITRLARVTTRSAESLKARSTSESL